MRGRLKLPIPTDWNEEDGYVAVLFCIPKSRDWQITARTVLSMLTFGRTWDETTGSIKDAQEMGREIFNSMQICNLEIYLERIAVALEAMSANQVGVVNQHTERIAEAIEAIEEKMPSATSLREMAEQISSDSWIGTFADAAEVLEFLEGIFPHINVDLRINAGELLMGAYQSLVDRIRFQTTMAQWTTTNTYLAALATAEAGEDVVALVDEATDNIWEGIGSFAQLLIFAESYYENISEFLQDLLAFLFGGVGGPQPGTKIEEILQKMQINLEEISNMQLINNINVSSCCDGGTGSPPENGQPIVEDEPLDDGGSYPPGFGSLNEYKEYKCKASQQIVEYLNGVFSSIGSWHNLVNENVLNNSGDAYTLIENWTYSLLPNAISYNMSVASLASWRQFLAYKLSLTVFDMGVDCETGLESPFVGMKRMFGVFSFMASSISENEDLLCELYQATNVTEAKTAIGIALSQASSYAIASDAGYGCNYNPQELEEFAATMISNGFVNILFTNSAYTKVLSANCEECETGQEYLAIFDFQDGAQNWVGSRNSVGSLQVQGYGSDTSQGMLTNYLQGVGDSWADATQSAIRDRAGYPSGSVLVDRVEFKMVWAGGVNTANALRVFYSYTDATIETLNFANPAPGTESYQVISAPNPHPEKPINFIRWQQNGGTNRRVFVVDDVRIYGSIS